jgi:putative ABC transport system substrate-binding protein
LVNWRKAGLALLLGLLALGATPLGADAQPAGKVYRVGMLSAGPAPGRGRLVEAFREGLRELGWVEGQNIVLDHRFAEGRFDRLPDLAAELVRLNVDVIVAGPTPPAVAAKNATGTIPIVAFGIGDPVALGLIASLARPGGNVTGISFSVGMEVFGKSLELLMETVPNVRRIAILSNPANPSHALAISNVKAAARSLGVQLQVLEVREPDQLDGAFAVMTKERVDALLVVADGMFILHRVRLADLAAMSQVPSIYGVGENVEAGGLMSYGPNLSDLVRRACTFVDKILKGAKAADLPFEQPTRFELVINLKTAKALGLAISPSLLLRADEVIQ